MTEPLILAAVRADDYRDAHDLLQNKMASIWTKTETGESVLELVMRTGSEQMKSVFKTAARNNLRPLFD